MGKLKETKIKSKTNTTAIEKSGATARQIRDAAVKALLSQGYATLHEAAAGEFQETGSVDKDSLINLPFIIVMIERKTSDQYPDSMYCAVTFIDANGKSGVLNGRCTSGRAERKYTTVKHTIANASSVPTFVTSAST